jgi:hypothetical protein
MVFDILTGKTIPVTVTIQGINAPPYAMFRANPQRTGEYDNGGIIPTRGSPGLFGETPFLWFEVWGR